MNRWIVLLAVVVMLTLAAVSCSGGGASPVTPTTDLGVSGSTVQTGQSQTHLWGYYDCYIDLETMTVEAVENRSTMFAANVVNFVNGNPANLAFNIKGTPIGTDYIDVDIDVSIRHPFPGMAQYNGYDVRGIFCGDGSESLDYNGDLDYPVLGTDQIQITKPGGSTGAPDGYTRWFNKQEFGTPGLGGYTPGLFASKNFNGNATLMPYKYFADGLSATGNLWDFLMGTNKDGVFSAGKTNTRNYYLRFPNAKGVKYGYAILANWIDPTTHPANAPEAVACDVTVTDNIYYVSNTDNGGDLIADFSLWGWMMQPDAIYIESNMFALHELDASEMTPTGGNETYSTYHVEIPTTDVSGIDGNEFWVIAELADYDYKSEIGVPNSAGADNLAAFFRYDVLVGDEPFNADPICDLVVVTPMPASWYVSVPVEFDASGSSDPDPGDVLTYAWDFDGDLNYDEDPDDAYDGDPWNPTHTYEADFTGTVSLMLTDGHGGEAVCSQDIEVTVTTCGTLTCPSVAPTTMIGTNRLYNYNSEPTRAAATPRVICAYSAASQICTIDVTGTSAYFITSPGYTIYNIANCSDDNIYVNDSGGTNAVFTMTYSESTGFGARTSFGSALPSGDYVHRMVVDEDDYPVVLARTSSGSARVYHWNGSGWGTGIDVPTSIMTEAGGSYSYIWDFDYDPSSGYFYIVERYNQIGVYAFDADGNVIWTDNDIWAGQAGTSNQPGIFIDKDDPECRLILMTGINSSGQTTYWARFNPVGGEKATGTTIGGTYGTTFSTFDGRGCVQISGGVARFLGATYGGNVWSSTIVPSW